jgi:hypothetical protein
MIKHGVVTRIKIIDDTKLLCIDCIQGQPKQEPIPKRSKTVLPKEYGEEVLTDVWGPTQTRLLSRSFYFLQFLDHATDEVKIYFQKDKGQTYRLYKKWQGWVTTNHSMTMNKTLRSDQGGEYMSKAFINGQDRHGTNHKLTVHNTPQQNSKAECMNQTMVAHACCMLVHANLPGSLWTKAMSHAAWLRNHTKTANTLSSTPYKQATGKKPDLQGLQMFGEEVWVKVDTQLKIESRAEQAMWVGYNKQSKDVFCVYWPHCWTVTVKHDVRFVNNNIVIAQILVEGEQHNLPRVVSNLPSTPNTPEASTEPPTIVEQPISALIEDAHNQGITRKSNTHPVCTKTASCWLCKLQALQGNASGQGAQKIPENLLKLGLEKANLAAAEMKVKGELNKPAYLLAAMAGNQPTYCKALNSPDHETWHEAMASKVIELKKQNTGTLVPLPGAGMNIIGNTLVLKKKQGAQNKILKYKACLCAQGFSQKPGVNYHIPCRCWQHHHHHWHPH